MDESTVKMMFAGIASDFPPMVEAALKKGCTPDTVNEDECPALFYAVANARWEIARLLLKLGANPELGLGSMTPLLMAAQNGDEAIARLLVGAGAKVDGATGAGLTPLMLAARDGRMKMVQALIDLGANPRAAMHDGSTARDIANSWGEKAVGRYLEEVEASMDTPVPSST